MSYAPAFLARLGLDPSADARAIRRAYARLLKQIDQETQAARFQSLRDDYEAALAWLAWRHEDAKDGDNGDTRASHNDVDGGTPEPQAPWHVSGPRDADAAPARDAMFGADSGHLADEVFQHFQGALATLRASRLTYDDALAELRRCIVDDRLLNIAAGAEFEARIAGFLAGPHQPDHETLLNAAIHAFGWASDRHRLDRFGHAGATLNRAIDEHTMFKAQSAMDRNPQRQALEALRKPGLPNARELRRLMPHLRMLMLRFPVLMTLIADQTAVERWRTACTAPGGNDGESFNAVGTEPAAPKGSYGWIVGVILLIFLSFNAMDRPNFNKSHARYSALKPTDEQAPSAAPAPPVDPYDRQPLKRAQLYEISSHILYRIDDEDRPGMRSVEYAVHLDAAGRIKSLDTMQASGSKGYDDAILRAIWASSPYAAPTARDFSITYTIRLAPEVRPYEFRFPPVPLFDPEHAATGSARPPPELTHSRLLPAPPQPTIMRVDAAQTTP